MTETEETLFNAYLGQKELADRADREAVILQQQLTTKKQQADAYRAEAKALLAQLGINGVPA